jgi:hypothetical protein
MVEIRVAVAEPAFAHGLMQSLAPPFDRSSIAFDRERGEVQVRSEWESRAVIQVIDVVDGWLAASGIASAKLSVGDRSHTLVGPSCPATTGGRTA